MALGNDESIIGVVKMWTDKGYGFIAADGHDYFAHFKDIVKSGNESGQNDQYKKLEKGQRVNFTPGEGKKGPVALKVTPL